MVPIESDDMDVRVRGTIVKSNGEELVVLMHVEDASGETWFSKEYRAEATKQSYTNVQKGHTDPYQDFYNSFSNDLLAFKQQLTPKDVARIRAVFFHP